ncbi:ParB N-terminal domain-containing protein [Amycolatopsis samaneae]|uniref:ParB N-terminal domain-containing protein n=1 Tax=Amycolatopsis samaneae TaxID=664691 RepID=A0ABW5GRI6_9PSEU
MAESGVALPPIIVHRATMRVVDGMHRLHAARLRGDTTIDVHFFDGDEHEAFVVAVESNIRHGLPLSLADRKAAAERIVRSHPHWSDRAIAARTGLSHKTVGAIRRRSGGEIPHSAARVGRDGRQRRLDQVDGRLRASELISRNPGAPIREIAEDAGISLSTAKDVRSRLRRGDDPVPPKQRREPPAHAERVPRQAPDRPGEQTLGRNRASAVRALLADPSLRYTEAGRTLLRWLHSHSGGEGGWSWIADQVPEHCRELVAELAHGCASDWQQFAERLDLLRGEDSPA